MPKLARAKIWRRNLRHPSLLVNFQSGEKNIGHQSLYTVQIGRGLAALLVLLYHANLIIGLEKYYGIRPANIFMLGRVGVEYFFVLSGFVMVIAHWRDLSNSTGSTSSLEFLWKRFRRLYPILWVVLAPLVILVTFAPNYSPAGGADFSDFLFALTIFPARSLNYIEPLLVVEWTLRYEIAFYALFLIFLKNKTVFYCISGPLILLGLATIFGLTLTEINFWASPFFLLFFLGMVGAWAYKTDACRYRTTMLAAGLTLFAFCAVVAVSAGFSALLTFGFGVAGTLIITGAALKEKTRPSALTRGLVLLGDSSYSVYLVHYPFLSIFTKVAVNWISSPQLAFAAVSLLALLGGVLFHILIERPLLKKLPRNMPWTTRKWSRS